MTHNPSMPQEGLSPQVCTRPTAVAAMAFRGEEAVRDVYLELRSDFKPYPPLRQRWPEGRDNSPDHAVDSRKDGPGV